jgi:hypothetical protein
MEIKDAVLMLASTYKSLDAVAQGLSVDAKEVDEALKEAKPDTAEYICLQYLAKYNPYTTIE